MSFFEELKRRKVFQVAVAYAIVGWLLAQIAATTLPILLLPDWILRAFVVIILLGFPLAIVLAWAFESTTEGIQRDRGETTPDVDSVQKSGRLSHVVLMAAATLLVGLLLGGVVGRMTAPVQETINTSKTPVQLTANPQDNPVIGSAISPDGKYLAYTETSGLYLRVIESGEVHQLPLSEEISLSHSEVDWFPDGTHLLLAARIGTENALWKLAIVGGEPRKLVSKGVTAVISPDGNSIAYLTEWFDSRVFSMGPEGEEQDPLINLKSMAIRELAWSPDGRFLLVGGSVRPDLHDTLLQAVDIASKKTHDVMQDKRNFQHWRGYLPFYWLPAGRLLFGRTEIEPSQKMSNIWQVKLDPDSAQPLGEPTQVTRLTGFNIRNISATIDGSRVSFLLEENQADVYIGDLGDGGRKLTNVRRFTRDERDDYPVGWSDDGSIIYFASDRGASANIFQKVLEGGSASLIGHTSSYQNDRHVQQSPDGKWILYWGDDMVLMRKPAAGGPGEVVLQGKRASDMRCPRATGADTDCIVSLREADNQYVFYAFDPEYGMGKKLLAVEDDPPFSNWSLAPDGKSVALAHNNGEIRIIDLEKGSEAVHSKEGWIFGEYVEWSADGHGVFMDGSAINRQFKKSLIYYSLDDREATLLREAPSQWHVLAVSAPDGSKLAFGLMKYTGNAWMIEKP